MQNGLYTGLRSVLKSANRCASRSTNATIACWCGVAACASMLGGSTGSRAQNAPRLVTVNGLAYDSLAKRPLNAALVSIVSVGRQTFSDEKGRWRIDSVPEGTYVFTLQHEAFDSLGLSGTSARLTVARNGPRVTLAVPSFDTMWRAACGEGKAPSDSMLVYGVVRDARTLEAQPQANIEVSWTDLVGGGKSLSNVGERRWRRTSSSDAHGEYALCGVALLTRLSVRAALDSVSFTNLELDAAPLRVRRLDVLVGRQTRAVVANNGTSVARQPVAGETRGPDAATLSGIVVGTIVNAAGLPLAGAAVAIDSLTEVRSGDDGRFIVRDVAVGTRQASVSGWYDAVQGGERPTRTITGGACESIGRERWPSDRARADRASANRSATTAWRPAHPQLGRLVLATT